MNASDYLEWAVLQFVIAMFLVMIVALCQVILAMLRGEVKPYRAFDGKHGYFEWKRFWTQAAKAILCYAMIKDLSDGSPTIELLAVCAALVGGHEFVSIWLDLKGKREPWTEERRAAAKEKPA